MLKGPGRYCCPPGGTSFLSVTRPIACFSLAFPCFPLLCTACCSHPAKPFFPVIALLCSLFKPLLAVDVVIAANVPSRGLFASPTQGHPLKAKKITTLTAGQSRRNDNVCQGLLQPGELLPLVSDVTSVQS